MTQKILWLAVALGLCVGAAEAQVTVRKGGSAKAGIDWSRLVAGGGAAAEFKRVLEDDLLRSGWFVPSAPGAEFTLVGVAQVGEVQALGAGDPRVGVDARGQFLLRGGADLGDEFFRIHARRLDVKHRIAHTVLRAR